MMDVRDFETRYLIKAGLANIRNPFIKGMVDKNRYSIGSQVTQHGIAWYVVPLVNAITRVGTIEEKTLVFESMLEFKAYNLIPSTKRGCKGQEETVLEQSLRTCTNVKNRQTRMEEAAVELIDKKIQNENLLDHKVILIQLESADFDRGITGLIANKIMAKYQKPVLLTIKGTEEGKIIRSGSGRAPGRTKLEDFRKFCEDSGLVNLAQGHPSAFGFSIDEASIPAFIDYCDKELAGIEFSPAYKVDFIYNSSTLKNKDLLEIAGLKSLWGQNLEEPFLVIENLAVTTDMLTLMSKDKNPTLKIQLPNGVSCIKFRSNEEEFEALMPKDLGCTIVNLVGTAQNNEWNGLITPQIKIEDYEIIGKQEFYF